MLNDQCKSRSPKGKGMQTAVNGRSQRWMSNECNLKSTMAPGGVSTASQLSCPLLEKVRPSALFATKAGKTSAGER